MSRDAEEGVTVDPHAAESAEVARLEALGGARPGAPVFPALAEAHRRAGDPENAARVAREGLAERPDVPAGRVALALALLDLERPEDARAELARVLDEVPGHALASAALEERGEARAVALEALDDGELEAAFEEAESEPDRMMDANHVAEATLRHVERGAPEGVNVAREDSPFATETVAALLQRQGHETEARAVRDAASRRAGDTGPASRHKIVATLERWLENVRRRAR